MARPAIPAKNTPEILAELLMVDPAKLPLVFRLLSMILIFIDWLCTTQGLRQQFYRPQAKVIDLSLVPLESFAQQGC